MKIRTCAALLIASLMLIISGCSLKAAEKQLDIVEDTVELHLEAAEDTAEARLSTSLSLPETLAAKPAPGVSESAASADETKTVETLPPLPSVHTAVLTQEEAETIALNHAGFTRNQVTSLRTEYDMDRRIPEFDIEFREGRWEYEYEIHAETGTILSFEKDD